MKDHLLVFIPGIMGTELFYSGRGKYLDKVTEPVWNEDCASLWHTLNTSPERLQITTDLQPGNVLRHLQFLRVKRPVYGPLLSFVTEQLNYEAGVDFVAFGYDWRQSNRVTAAKLAHFLREKLADSLKKVKLITHSMGGVIARLLLATDKHRDVADKVTSLIQIGTPVRGSSRAYLTLKEGPRFGGICDFLVSMKKHVEPQICDRLNTTLRSLPSLFELLPHGTDKILLTQTGESYAALDKRVWPLMSDEVLESHVETHAMIRKGRAPFIISIYSVDILTDSLYLLDPDLAKVEATVPLRGDGTVLTASAALDTSLENCHPISDAITHDALPNYPKVLQFLKAELEDDAGKSA
jgi:pimeloyl-ACP methyl ester carboxylesterase